jgi:Domain of unknown function (DUF4129)
MKFLCVAAFLLATTPVTSAHASGAQVIDLGTYIGRVHAIRVQLDRVAGQRKLSVAGVQTIQGELRTLQTVAVPDGPEVQSDLPLLAAQIDPTNRSTIRAAAAELDGLDSALQGLGTPHTDSTARSALDHVYADPRFHPPCSVVGCAWQWVSDHGGAALERAILWLFQHGPSSLPISPALAVISLLLCLLLAGGVGFLAVRGALRRVTVQERALGDEEARIGQLPVEELSRKAQRAGDFRTAFRYLYLSVMLDLQRRGLIRLRPGWTNRDQIRSLSPSAASLQAPLGEMVDVFDRVWYGHDDIDEQEYRRLLALSQNIKAEGEAAA